MKKLLFSFLFILLGILVVSCSDNQEVDINQFRDFNLGDTIEYKGVIYEFFTDEYINSTFKSQQYMFKEEENYKSYYDYYYYDMSDYKNQNEMKPIGTWDYYERKGIDSDIDLSPTSAYYLRLFPILNCGNGNEFIITGYTDQLPKHVEIPKFLFGYSVEQIGFKAFENAPMESIQFRNSIIIHPYAFHNCNNLKTISFDERGLAKVLSMGISDCAQLEVINAVITPYGDCVCYNLPNLVKIEDINIPLHIKLKYKFCLGLGGVRKSFLYNCPKFEQIGDSSWSFSSYIKDNVLYTYDHNPIYVFDNYKLQFNEQAFKYETRNQISVVYNPNTFEAYIPFLNDGLDKKGEIIVSKDSDILVEEDDGIYAYVTYENEEYNAKVLIKRK